MFKITMAMKTVWHGPFRALAGAFAPAQPSLPGTVGWPRAVPR